MKLAMISDLHGMHEQWISKLDKKTKKELNKADALIIAGDVTNIGREAGVRSFLQWFNDRPNKYKIMIAGNHDFYFDTEYMHNTNTRALTRFGDAQVPINNTTAIVNNMLKQYNDIIYLNDSGITLDGVNFWGSPITPVFHYWAFNREQGSDIVKHWDLIPDNTDVLITHGPPYTFMDTCADGSVVGCPGLLKKVQEIEPKVHVFGHIHEGYGLEEVEGITFVNACSVNEYYHPINPPIFKEI